jgi:hypothetical protein
MRRTFHHFVLPLMTAVCLAASAVAQSEKGCPINSSINHEKSKPPDYVCSCNPGFKPLGPACAKLTGIWKPEETKMLAAALAAVKNEQIRKWLTERLEFVRYRDDNSSPITASGGKVRVKDGFFDLENRYMRENLLTFESGKAFWDQMKDRPLAGQGGKALQAWFASYSLSNANLAAQLRMTRHGQPVASDTKALPVDMSIYADLVDYHSSFGHFFRAEALRLPADKAKLNEFQTTIAPLLR